jgi:integrase
LLAACQGERKVTYSRVLRGRQETVRATHKLDNPRLKAMILLALDSGLRRGEILKLRWEHFDFENRSICILGTHTKTERERLVPLTSRTADELRRVRALPGDEKPFDFLSFKRSWATATRLAGIEGLQFRDLRRTAITRWQQQEIPLALAGKLAGHSQLQTTMKHYTSTDLEMVRGVSERMNEYHDRLEDPLVSGALN